MKIETYTREQAQDFQAYIGLNSTCTAIKILFVDRKPPDGFFLLIGPLWKP